MYRILPCAERGRNMTLTSEDLLAISNLLDVKLKPIDNRLTNLEIKVDNLETMVDAIDNRLTSLEVKVDAIDNRLTSLEVKVDAIDNRLTSIEVHIENVTDKNIALLAENYVPAARQFEKASYKIEALQADNDIIKKVLGEHSKKLEKIS